MKTIQQLQNKEDWLFFYNNILVDFLRIVWVYVVVCLLVELFS